MYVQITVLYFAAGGLSGMAQNYILSYNIASNTWDEIGRMVGSRYGHAVSVVPLSDIYGYLTCI